MAIMPLGLDDIVYYFSMLSSEFPTLLDGSPVLTCDTSKIIMPLGVFSSRRKISICLPSQFAKHDIYSIPDPAPTP